MEIVFKEKNLINMIRFGAICLIIIFSFIITNIFINQKNIYLDSEIKEIEKHFIEHNKNEVKSLVNKIHDIIKIEKINAKEELRKKIKEEVYQAHKIASIIYEKNIKKDNYSKEKTIEEIKTILKTISFNKNRGYIVISDEKGKIVSHPVSKFEGKNFINLIDINGYKFVETIVKTIKEKTERFDEYYWYKGPKEEKAYKKTGFYKYFEPYNFSIGSGDYLDEFEKDLQKRVLKKLNELKLKKPEHIFIYDLEGLCLVNPKKEFIGVNRYNAKNKQGEYGLRNSLKFVEKNKEGFKRYKASIKLNENLKSNDKISFLKLFEDWKWMIGSGFYLEEMHDLIESKKESLSISNQNAIEQIIFISFIVTIIMIIISFYLSKVIASIFTSYRNDIEKELKKSLEKDRLLVQQSKMATMGEMIGNIAHQWKQPLNLISMSNGLVKLNQEDNTFSTKEELNDALNNIDNSVHHLSSTIDDFRNFFRPNKEKIYFDLQNAFNKTYKLVNAQLKDHNISIIENIENIEIYGYENELLQVLINIIKNSKDELVKLEKEKDRVIFINIYKDNKEAIIEIKDNAGGIKEEIKDKIFNAYFTTKESSEGTGIGLYMSKQIIEGMNGTIDVSNSEYTYKENQQKGASFKITLPYV